VSGVSIKVAFNNNTYNCFLVKKGELLGVGRALAYGVDCSYICGVAIFPSHQKLGLDKKVISKLIELSKVTRRSYCIHALAKKIFT